MFFSTIITWFFGANFQRKKVLCHLHDILNFFDIFLDTGGGGGETGSMYVLSYELRWYVHIYNSMVHARTDIATARCTYLGLFSLFGTSMNVVCAGTLG